MEGTEFAGHLIEEEIGRGGMGIVYRARHLALDRVRALKILTPSLSADPRYAERFRRESRLAASVDHPAVVAVHHAGEEDGRLYMSMQYVDGVDLGRMLADGPISPGRTEEIIRRLAAGLDAAHEAGLIHRDVKPENVLLSGSRGSERVHLTDFGIGTLAEPAGHTATKLTTEGAVLGTSAYMAPEQIEAGAVDGRADIYSLACVAFHMLTGEAPFAGRSELATLAAHGTAPRPLASDRNPALGPAVDRALASGMAVDPAARPASASGFAALLADAIGGGPEAPTAPLAPPRRKRSARTGVALAIVAAAAAITALAIALLAGGGDEPAAPALPAPVAIETPRDPVAVAAGGTKVWVAGRDSDRVTALTHDGGRPFGRGTSLENPRALALGFGSLWAVGRDGLYRIDLDDGEPTGRIPLEDPSDVAAGGRHIWVLDRGEQPRVLQVDPATLRVTAQGFVGNDPRSLAVGAGAVWVTNTADGSISEVDADSGRIVGNPIDVGGRPTNVAASGGRVWVVDNFGGRLIPIDAAAPTPSAGAAVSTPPHPRGIAIGLGALWVTSGEAGVLIRFDLDGGGPTGRVEVGADPADVDVGSGSVWTADQDSDTVSRIDPGG
ncbi:MAG: protein kinase [Solirubrobacterales bacterium]|nr:protein kinase [Solirubrobacterales bacterium]